MLNAESNIVMLKRALNNDPHCGDECAWWQDGPRITLCVADGLGHGILAEEASHAAVAYVKDHRGESLTKIFSDCNSAIRRTRGVAMGLAVIDTAADEATIVGVGNIRMVVAGEKTKHVGCYNGIVGGGFQTLHPETVDLAPGDLVVMCSDGLKQFGSLPDDATMPSVDLRRLAERLMDDWGRGRDDQAILVFRYSRSQENG